MLNEIDISEVVIASTEIFNFLQILKILDAQPSSPIISMLSTRTIAYPFFPATKRTPLASGSPSGVMVV